MIKKIDNAMKFGNSHISIMYPGQVIGMEDSGIGSIGRIDQANIQGGTTIKMHPHINDEILSYFRTGSVIHTDSSGITETISRNKLMLMKAGKVFHHEEKIIDRLEGLQIFIRPMTADYEPNVLFHDLEKEESINKWRLLASNQPSSILNFTSETEVYDLMPTNVESFSLPKTVIENPIFLLYTFQGDILVNENISLSKGESIVTDKTDIFFTSGKGAEVVLFITNQYQNCFNEGMFSGNKI